MGGNCFFLTEAGNRKLVPSSPDPRCLSERRHSAENRWILCLSCWENDAHVPEAATIRTNHAPACRVCVDSAYAKLGDPPRGEALAIAVARVERRSDVLPPLHYLGWRVNDSGPIERRRLRMIEQPLTIDACEAVDEVPKHPRRQMRIARAPKGREAKCHVEGFDTRAQQARSYSHRHDHFHLSSFWISSPVLTEAGSR
jgi:hypothetical protein